MGDRWVTFDCFGTIVDWNAALADALVSVFGGEPREQLIDDFHQAERDLKHAGGFQLYRDVPGRSMRQMGRPGAVVLLDDEAAAIARAWPAIVPFADSPAGSPGSARARLATRHPDELRRRPVRRSRARRSRCRSTRP